MKKYIIIRTQYDPEGQLSTAPKDLFVCDPDGDIMVFNTRLAAENIVTNPMDPFADEPGIVAEIPIYIENELPRTSNLLLNAVSAVCRVDVNKIRGKSRKERVVDARAIYSIISRNELKKTLTEIAKDLNRSHSAIVHLTERHYRIYGITEKYTQMFDQVMKQVCIK